jgi:hypothetical protein
VHQKLVGTLAAIGLTLLCTFTLSGQNAALEAASETATKWEHLALSDDLKRDAANEEVGRRINQLGRDGWQLVDVEGIIEDGTTTKTVYYFKRQQG